MIGSRLGHFRITGNLGAGAMGEVYLATDTKLGREVAIKVLPEEFSANPKRLARFQREARLLASLKHSNIAAIYSVEFAEPSVDDDPDTGTRGARGMGRLGMPLHFIVMEFVPGESLEEMLDQGSLSIEKAIDIARQMAAGLESAHESGVIHRDLKPANIKVTPEGQVLLLDFGLAKALEDYFDEEGSEASTLTAAGAIVGTPAYMSPEQASAGPVDRRVDIWAFGCVLYEMLTGQRPFQAASPGAMFHLDPDWKALPPRLHPRVGELLRRCLRKDPRRRLRDIGDARLELDELAEVPARAADIDRSARSGSGIAGWAVAGLLLLGLVPAILLRPQPRPQSSPHLSVQLAGPLADVNRTVVAPSPDGSVLAYIAEVDGTLLVHVRPLDSFQSRALPGTDGARALFFSPDGEWIGFWAGQKLRKIPTRGGPVEIIAETAQFAGAAWASDGSIYYGSVGAVRRVAATGETPEEVTELDGDRGEVSHEYPQLLNDETALLFEVTSGGSAPAVAVQDLSTGRRQIVLEDAAFPRFSESGHLTFLRSGAVFAAAFDARRWRIKGTPVAVLEDVLVTQAFDSAQFSFATDGTMVFVPRGANRRRRVESIDRTGSVEPVLDTPRNYYMPRVSPQGNRLAVNILSEGTYDVWVLDLVRGTLSRLTTKGSNLGACWSPDGRRIAYYFDSPGDEASGILAVDVETGVSERLTSATRVQVPTSWSPDGKTILFTEIDPQGTENILALPLDSAGPPFPVAATRFNESGAVFAPDGRWIAYSSPASGTRQVFVQAFPGPGPKLPVSGTRPASMPVWAPDGRELFFLSGTEMHELMMVAFEPHPELQISTPLPILTHQFGGSIGLSLSRYDVARDGQRFYFATPDVHEAPRTVNVVLNWLEVLEATVSTSSP